MFIEEKKNSFVNWVIRKQINTCKATMFLDDDIDYCQQENASDIDNKSSIGQLVISPALRKGGESQKRKKIKNFFFSFNKPQAYSTPN